MTNKQIVLYILIFSLWLAGCSTSEFVQVGSEPAAMLDAAFGSDEADSAENERTISRDQALKPSLTNAERESELPLDWAGIEQWLRDARQAELPVQNVHNALVVAGWQQAGTGIFALDLTGDGRDEWVLILQTPQQESDLWGPTGNLWVMAGGVVIYRFHAAFDADDRQWTPPRVSATGDVTGDGLPELFVDHPLCGAHTCSTRLRVLHGGGGTIENIVWRELGLSAENQTIQVSTANLTLSAPNKLIVRGGGIGSAGAGIPRLYSEVWAYSAETQQLMLESSAQAETNYRHHLLYEANALAGEEKYIEAKDLYQTVVHDETLQDTESLHNPPTTTYNDARQFAAFRLVWLGIKLSDPALATQYRDWLLAHSTDLVITRAAQAIYGAQDAVIACETAQRTLKEVDHPAGALTYMGYANPTLTHDAFCP